MEMNELSHSVSVTAICQVFELLFVSLLSTHSYKRSLEVVTHQVLVKVH